MTRVSDDIETTMTFNYPDEQLDRWAFIGRMTKAKGGGMTNGVGTVKSGEKLVEHRMSTMAFLNNETEDESAIAKLRYPREITAFGGAERT